MLVVDGGLKGLIIMGRIVSVGGKVVEISDETIGDAIDYVGFGSQIEAQLFQLEVTGVSN